MDVPDDLLYTKEHEWVRVENDIGVVGITDYAQSELGDVVFVELPEVGNVFNAQAAFGTVESVKAVSEAYMPVSGEIVKVNQSLLQSPERINEDPYGDGWMIRIRMKNRGQLDDLMSAEQYIEYVGEVSEG